MVESGSFRDWNRDPVTHLGFWSAVVAALSATVFSVAAGLELVNAIPEILGLQLIYASSFVLAVAFVVMMSSIHQTVPENRGIWSFLGISFAILYASNSANNATKPSRPVQDTESKS